MEIGGRQRCSGRNGQVLIVVGFIGEVKKLKSERAKKLLGFA